MSPEDIVGILAKIFQEYISENALEVYVAKDNPILKNIIKSKDADDS